MGDSRRSSICSKDETDSIKQGTLKSKDKSPKSSNVNRIINLFEIPRPNKHNTLEKYQKQKSLDCTIDKQDVVLSPKSRANSVGTSSIESESEGLGKVKRIAAKLEKNCDVTNGLIHKDENNNSRRKAKSNHSRRKHKSTKEVHRIQERYDQDKPPDLGCQLSLNNTNTYDANFEDNFVFYEIGKVYDNDKNSIGGNTSNSSTLERQRKFIKNPELKRNDSYSTKKRGAKNVILSKNYSRKNLESTKSEYEEPRDGTESKMFQNERSEGDTESYRRSLILQMDKCMAKMKEDGFIIDQDFSDKHVAVGKPQYEYELEEPEYCEILEDPTYQNILQTNDTKSDDDFGETQFNEDLEQGLYFVEAYNIDNKELVIVSMQIDRKSIHINSMGEMKEITSDSDLHFHQNEKTLVLINDIPKKFVRKSNSLASSGHYSMDDANSSKRNTVYSTASGDSFEDYDEGIDLENIEGCKDLYSYNSARRETYCDRNGVIRIERVAYPQNVYESVGANNEQTETTAGSSVAENKDKLSYIIDEIIATERKYVDDLEKVIREYKPHIESHPLSPFLGKVSHIFGNIEELYRRQRVFLDALESSDSQVESVIQLFIDFENLFEIYPVYFKSKPRAEIALKEFTPVIRERQEQLSDRLDLSSYLLTPLQRLGRYKLFLESISKQLEKNRKPTHDVTKALDIIRREMSKGNDVIAIESIFHSPLDKHEYGSFIRREKFVCLKPKKLDLMVFLFEYVIIFTTEDPRNMEIYNYWESIKTNDLRIATFEDATIHLTDFTRTKKKNSSKYNYILDAKSVKLKELWRKDIEDILWQQLKSAKENTLKLYKKDKATIRPEMMRKARIKSTGSSVFYINE